MKPEYKSLDPSPLRWARKPSWFPRLCVGSKDPGVDGNDPLLVFVSPAT